ncbi:hypothetical protein [Amycolatopsis arida]|nr:hypothetical protein [Amycolatopsis arida]
MDQLVARLNTSPDLASVEVSSTEGAVFPGASPVLGTPGAFLGGVAIASATVAAFEAGRG